MKVGAAHGCVGASGGRGGEGVSSSMVSWTPTPGCCRGLFSGPHAATGIFIQDGNGASSPAHTPRPPRKPYRPNMNQTPWNEPE